MAELIKYPDDPTATYRGYRRQALYSLYRLFDDGLPDNCVLQPEGNEDLAIFGPNGELIEVVQVKDYTPDLSVSKFKPSFFNRIGVYCAPESTVAVTIVSYGGVGPELTQALDNEQATPDRALTTLTNYLNGSDSKEKKDSDAGLNSELAENIFRHVNLLTVDEETLTADVVNKLKATITSADPQSAFENLMWWLISSAEKKSKLTRAGTIEKLHQIGQFIDDRAIHEHEWNVSIKPIQRPVVDQSNEEKLKREFFQGGRVTAEHIAADIDVRRIEALNGIHESFQKEDVVIIRAASGQGKTTLAYRYLLDWTPNDFRFEVLQAADLQHARRMSVAIAGHVEILDVPTVVYVDVHSGDTLWVEFVRELTNTSGIRVLVTIREEDWFRARITDDDFRCVELNLSFDEMKGRELYDALRAVGYGDSYLDFNDVWSKLGERKTLFEFVYLMTQNERLAQRIEEQISTLRDEVNRGDLQESELHLLRLVAIASSYEARLDLKRLASHVGIPEITRTLERFSNEYLLRTTDDGQHVEGFHAIRSEIIAAKLSDKVLQPRDGLEAEVVPLVVEDDLETFLLCSFSRNPESAERVVKALQNVGTVTWSGVRGVMSALLWLGIKEYEKANAVLIDDIRRLVGTGWWFYLDWDLAQFWGPDGRNFYKAVANNIDEFETAEKAVESVRAMQTYKGDVFLHVKPWLCSFAFPTCIPDGVDELMAAAEVLYWMGHLQIANSAVIEMVDERMIARAFSELPIHKFAEFACAIRRFSSSIYENWLGGNRRTVETRIREQASIIAMKEEENCLVSHFVIAINQNTSKLSSSHKGLSVNDLAVERVEVVSRCLPGYEKYGASGYGHQLAILGETQDDSHKRMPIENIVIPWLPDFNALSYGAVEYRFRVDSWKAYFNHVQSVRQSVVATFHDLRIAIDAVLTKGPSKERISGIWEKCRSLFRDGIFLPADAVDPWGFVTESRASPSSNKEKDEKDVVKKYAAIAAIEPFNKAIKEYLRTINNFSKQSDDSLYLVPRLRLATSHTDKKVQLAGARNLKIDERAIRLSVLNLGDACLAVQHLHRVERELSQILVLNIADDTFRQHEFDEFIVMMRSWAMFCFPEQCGSQTKNKRRNQRRRRPELRDCLRPISNRISDALKKLKTDGIDSRIMREHLQWNQESALWISFDMNHPRESENIMDSIWGALNSVFKSDLNKIVRLKTIDIYWERIVVVPLLRGRSLEKAAYSNMGSVIYALEEDIATRIKNITPELIRETTWSELGLSCWEPQDSWEVFDNFRLNYGSLYHYVNHIADFARCSQDIDIFGEEILRDSLMSAQEKTQQCLDLAFESLRRLLKSISDHKSEATNQANLQHCEELVCELQESLPPTENVDNGTALTLDEMAEWRDRLTIGFVPLDMARQYWIAHSLGIEAVG